MQCNEKFLGNVTRLDFDFNSQIISEPRRQVEQRVACHRIYKLWNRWGYCESCVHWKLSNAFQSWKPFLIVWWIHWKMWSTFWWYTLCSISFLPWSASNYSMENFTIARTGVRKIRLIASELQWVREMGQFKKNLISTFQRPLFLVRRRKATNVWKTRMESPKLSLWQRNHRNVNAICCTKYGRMASVRFTSFYVIVVFFPYIFFTIRQCTEGLNGRISKGRSVRTELSHRNVHLLHRVLHRVSVFLRQHIRCINHRNISGARWSWTRRRRSWQKSSESMTFYQTASNKSIFILIEILHRFCD